MKILLEIPEDTLGKYQFEADKEKRSRKNFMEKVLVDYFEKPKTIVQDLTKPTNEIKSFEQPKSNFIVNSVAKSFEQYRAEKRACELPEQWEALEKEIDADQYLTSKQKHLLKTIV